MCFLGILQEFKEESKFPLYIKNRGKVTHISFKINTRERTRLLNKCHPNQVQGFETHSVKVICNESRKSWKLLYCRIFQCKKYWINPYSTNVSLLYPLKTSENLRFSDVFRGYRSETLVENRLNWQAFHPVAGINCQARKVQLWDSLFWKKIQKKT